MVVKSGIPCLMNTQMKETLEKCQLKSMKPVLRVRQQTSMLGVRGELGEYPLETSINTQIVKFSLRILEMPDDSLVKQLILLSLNDLRICRAHYMGYWNQKYT